MGPSSSGMGFTSRYYNLQTRSTTRLFLRSHSADDNGRLDSGVFGGGNDVVLDLDSQFAGGSQHQGVELPAKPNSKNITYL